MRQNATTDVSTAPSYRCFLRDDRRGPTQMNCQLKLSGGRVIDGTGPRRLRRRGGFDGRIVALGDFHDPAVAADRCTDRVARLSTSTHIPTG